MLCLGRIVGKIFLKQWVGSMLSIDMVNTALVFRFSNNKKGWTMNLGQLVTEKQAKFYTR